MLFLTLEHLYEEACIDHGDNGSYLAEILLEKGYEAPEYTADVDAMGTLSLLEATCFLGLEQKTRFYQASTSELCGLVQ